ncbi:MAG: hypothetical protein GX410_07285 [Elusimicrobia bacterium]|nr:hypothetical protein [Elusimicrobiota bacterium]
MASDFARTLRTAGVVGAGGAGFPTYVKASSKAETAIVNAAECEPLLHKDIELISHHAETMLDGLELLMSASGAKQGIVGIKRKHGAEIKLLQAAAAKRRAIKIHPLDDFYPAGDEYCLVYETTRRTIPPGGLPLDAGAVVCNVETLFNAARAEKTPVTEKYLTVTGEVKNPVTLKLPVGLLFSEAIKLAGTTPDESMAVIDGGPMMGRIVTDFSEPVTKTTGGLIVLPKNHPLIQRKAQQRPQFSKVGRSACDQCSFCTQLCPRYLLGYAIEPHKAMRTLLFNPAQAPQHNEYALLCCECSLCTLYSCPEGLNPKSVCVSSKADLRAKGVTFKNSAIKQLPGQGPHPLREFRKTPVSRLVARLGLSKYKERKTGFSEAEIKPAFVRLLLSQHVGAPAKPVVKTGDAVLRGMVVADVKPEELGVPVHASINGTVSEINSRYIEIRA